MRESGKKNRVLARLLAMLLAAAMTVSLPLPFLPHGEAEAAGSTKNITNVVIFVKHSNDPSDIFNATSVDNTGQQWSNWKRIKKMYDEGNGIYGNNSFSSYIWAVTEGTVKVTNYFPQEKADKNGVLTLTLSRNSYGGSDLVEEVIDAAAGGKIHLDTSACKLDNQSSNVIDNLTIILQGDTIGGRETAFHSTYAGAKTINGMRVFDYNIIPSGRLLPADAATGHVYSEQGVIAHEFLHTLGLPDLYRRNDSVGQPVGIWDIMASVSPFLQYPLSYLRARQGWISMGNITQSGTYTLTAASETGGTKVFALRTPLSSSEFICLEYRKKNDFTTGTFEQRIPSSGLLMYRVDPKVYSLTNGEGKNYIYVYRPGVTNPEAAGDTASNGLNLVHNAALDGTAGKKSYGSTDLNADFTKNTLYYSDGSNSGIQISDVSISSDQKTLTFRVTFADYKDVISWENMGDTVSNQCIGDPFVCTDPATGTVYAAFLEEVPGGGSSKQICVKKWDGAAWRQVGDKIAPVSWTSAAALAVCGGEVYLSYLDQSSQPVYSKLENGSWKQVARHNVSYPKYMQFAVDGSNLYAAYEDSGRWKIYNLKSNSLVDSSLTAGDFSRPAMLASAGGFYMVYADSNGGAARIQKYDRGSWSTVDTLPVQHTNMHQIAAQGGYLYAFAGGGEYGKETGVMAVFDGTGWTNTTIPDMKQFNAASMAMVGNQVCLAYYDTGVNKVKLLQGTGSSFQQVADNLGTGVDYLGVCSYGSNLYIATRAQNTSNLVVRRKVVSGGSVTPPVTPPVAQEPYLLTLTPPAEYTDSHIYIDGVEYTATRSGGGYQLKLPDASGQTAVMYSYDSRNIPVGMYVWRLSWEGENCKAVPLPGLQNLLSYHGFSIRVQSPAGIRFKSGIESGLKQQLLAGAVDGCRLKEYGTLFITNENREKYPFVKDGTKVGGGRAYWTENGKVYDKVFETVAGRNRFTSVLINLAPNMYDKDISFRAYAVLECNGQDLIIYGPPVYRSVYTVAKQVQAKGEFKPGSSGYRYVQGIIESVEKR